VNAADFPPIPAERARAICERLNGEAAHVFLGLVFEEIREDYARCRLGFRPELLQAEGVVHGGLVAALIDGTVIGAMLSRHDLETVPKRIVTLSVNVQFLDAVVDTDVIAEARVRRRGRSVCFLDVEARDPTGREVAHGEVTAYVTA
jgi:uncharacterized protein (TIGR00369 family)